MSKWKDWKRRRGHIIPKILQGLFGGSARSELVATHFNLAADPDVVWDKIVLYEDVTGHPPLLLRLFVPYPVRTEGEKKWVGALVRCVYDGGDLVKRIVALEPPYRMAFDVLEQRLGIEGCVVAQKGSYDIDRAGNGSDVVLTTQYRAFLHPRWLWRPIERVVASQLHLHILRGMRERGADKKPVVQQAVQTRPSLPALPDEDPRTTAGLANAASQDRFTPRRA